MKIYFSGSIRGGRDDIEIYSEIINLLANYGEVITEHVGDKSLLIAGENNLSDKDIYERDMALLSDADVIVAEVSTPSLGVGYEIAKAENQKPTLCLFRRSGEKSLSAIIGGNENLVVLYYSTIKDIEEIFKKFFLSLG